MFSGVSEITLAYAGEALCAQLNFSRISLSYAAYYAYMNISWSTTETSGSRTRGRNSHKSVFSQMYKP
jgi:hypothetical protein